MAGIKGYTARAASLIRGWATNGWTAEEIARAVSPTCGRTVSAEGVRCWCRRHGIQLRRGRPPRRGGE